MGGEKDRKDRRRVEGEKDRKDRGRVEGEKDRKDRGRVEGWEGRKCRNSKDNSKRGMGEEMGEKLLPNEQSMI